MRNKKLLTLTGSVCLILIFTAMPFMAACAPEEVMPPPEEEEAPPPAEKSIVTICFAETPPAGMNPFLARSEGDYVYLGLMYEPLCMPMMDGTVEPWIAKDWEYNVDEQAWVFHLDERAKWSDGEPLTAEDVKFTFDVAYQLDLPLGATTQAFVDSIEAVDDHTVKFNMASPFAAFVPKAGSMLIMPKHIWSEVGDVTEYANPNPVGSGPFLFKEYEPRRYFRAVKDEDYWRGPAHIDEVVIRVYTEADAELAAIAKGDVDINPVLSLVSAVPVLLTTPDLKVVVQRWTHNFYLAINHRVYPLNLKEVRQAMDVAIDRKRIAEDAFQGYMEYPPTMGYVPPMISNWLNPEVTWKYADVSEEDRISTANAMLDDLGLEPGKDGIRRTEEGEKLHFRLRTMSTNPSYVRASEMVKQDLAKIGIEIEILTSDPQTLYSGIIYSGKNTEDWELMVHGTIMDPDPEHIARSWAPETPTSWDNATAFGYKNEELKSLLQDSNREMDFEKRHEMIMEAQELIADDLPVIMLGHRELISVYRTDKYTNWNLARICYVGMFYSSASIVNLLSLRPK